MVEVEFGFAALKTQDTSISFPAEIGSADWPGVFNRGSFIPPVPSGNGASKTDGGDTAISPPPQINRADARVLDRMGLG